MFADYWNPRIIGELNGPIVKAVKLNGEFVWHHHDHEDELFLVIKGKLRMEFRDKAVEVNEGEFIIVPNKTEHKPVPMKKFICCCLNRFNHAEHTGTLKMKRQEEILNESD